MGGLRSDVRRIERRLENARRFFGTSNLELAIVALGGGLSIGPGGGLAFKSREDQRVKELRSDGQLYEVP
jgi:transketolase N-terminal domain/subunit